MNFKYLCCTRNCKLSLAINAVCYLSTTVRNGWEGQLSDASQETCPAIANK